MPPGPAHTLLKGLEGPCALLESTMPGGAPGWPTILARRPRALLVSDRRSTRIVSSSGTSVVGGDPIEALRALLRDTPPGRWPSEGGVVGALAYDFARRSRGGEEGPLLIALAVDRFEIFEAPGSAPPPPPLRTSPRSRLDLPSLSSLTRAEYRDLVRRVKAHVSAGDIYQANLSQRFRLPWSHGGLVAYALLRGVNRPEPSG